MPLEPGDLDTLVVIQCRVDDESDPVDDAGTPTEENTDEWEDLCSIWMGKADLTTRERFIAQQLASRFDTKWRMQYRQDMDPDRVDVPKVRRLVYNDRTLDIITATVIGRREGIELMTIASSAVVVQ